MPIEKTKPSKVESLHKQCNALAYATKQDAKWKTQVADDLNTLLSRAVYFLETSKDESDIWSAKATLRIVKRVAEFEGIRRAGQ